MEYLNTVLAPVRVAANKVDEFIKKTKQNDSPERIYDPHSKVDQYKSMLCDPILIIDNIYLGNAVNAASYYKLKELNIGMILNVTDEISNYYPNDFIYLNYKLSDNGKDKISGYLTDSYQTMIDYMENNPDKKILVHCYMGASRSASIIIHYIMAKHSKTFDEAIQIVKEKKAIVNISKRFKEDIIELTTPKS